MAELSPFGNAVSGLVPVLVPLVPALLANAATFAAAAGSTVLSCASNASETLALELPNVEASAGLAMIVAAS